MAGIGIKQATEKKMEKKIKIAGRIGNTVFQNNDSGKVLYRGGIAKYIRTMEINTPMVLKRWIKRSSKSDKHTKTTANPESYMTDTE